MRFGVLLVLLGAVSVESNLFTYDIARSTCSGGLYLFPGSKMEVSLDASMLTNALDQFYAAVKAEALEVCPQITDDEFKRRFVPGVESIVNLFDARDDTTSCPRAFARAFATDSPWTLYGGNGRRRRYVQAMEGTAVSPLSQLDVYHLVS